MTDFEIIVAFAYIYFLIDYLLKENKKMNLQEKIEALEKQLQELKEEVNKGEEQFPKEGDKYYFIDMFGYVEIDTWSGGSGDYNSLKIGNVFKTEEEAEFMVERLKVIAKFNKLGRPFKVGKQNWFLHYDHTVNDIRVVDFDSFQHQPIYFESKEEALEAIEKIGEERIKKYYLRIEEGEK